MLNLCAPERTVRRNTHLALVLTAIAGILNSVGFVAVATYTSHMTGIVASMADAAVPVSYTHLTLPTKRIV